jgi:signal transduction histidine kinase
MRKNVFLVYGLFFISLVILGSLSLTFYQRYSVYTQYADAVEQTYETIAELNRLTTYLKDVETGQRGFLLTNDSSFLQTHMDGVLNIKNAFKAVQQLTRENVTQQERLKKLNILIQDKIKSMDHTRFMFLFNRKQYMANFMIEKEKMSECHEILSAMEHEELQLLGMRQESKEIYQSSTPQFLKALFAFSAFTFLGSFTLIVREFRRRVRYQKELEQKIAELAQSHTELEQIAYIASHDLQEPLRKINTFSDRLESKHAPQLNEEGQKIIGRLSYASIRMRDLIEDLANYTSLVKTHEKKTRVALSNVVEIVIQQHEDKMKEKNVRVVFDDLPYITGYSHQLVLLFDALLDNSIKFTREDVPLVITISSAMTSSEEFRATRLTNGVAKYVKIIVKDNGIGFDNEFAEKVFVIFQRLHNQHSEYAGKGVGLAIVKRVMTNHNGFVFAMGRPMEGAEFILLFPIQS